MQSQTGKNDRPPGLSIDLNAGYVMASFDAGSQRGERMATAAQRLDAALADFVRSAGRLAVAIDRADPWTERAGLPGANSWPILDDALADFARPIQNELEDALAREAERSLGVDAARWPVGT